MVSAVAIAPEELGIDLLDGTFYAKEPYEAYAWMRAHSPVYYDERNDLWAAASYATVKQASVDTDSFSNAQGIRPKSAPLPMMIEFDAPEHVLRRRLVSEGFTPKRVRAMEDRLRLACDSIIDAVCEQGHCDFVADIAAPLPIAVIGDMLGFAPEHRAELLRWSDDMLKSQGSPDPDAMERAMEAFVGYSGYINPVLARRRADGSTDDLAGVLCHAVIDGHSLDDDSLIHETLLILIGGDETTRHVISGGMDALLAHPDQLARLAADPAGRLPAAVEEMLRWVSPIKNMNRTATRDVELGGEAIRAGQQIILLYPSANRDEEVFDQPDVFDIGRTPNPHIAFGFGAHFCLGNQLARLELKVMFDRLLARLPDLRLAVDPSDLPRRPANFISGIEQMPVEFTPSAPLGVGPA
jgi:cytochrome P450 family 142 subfamily A polypeptide 1